MSAAPDEYSYKADTVESVLEIIQPGGAWIVRNHYGAEVLITRGAAALPMIDVDLQSDSHFLEWVTNGFSESLDVTARFEHALNEAELGNVVQLRIYRTASGYRLLVESQALRPHGKLYSLLAEACGADSRYVALCLRQRCFRSRLTPKPWRLHGAGDPNAVGVCRYIESIGRGGVDEHLAPLIHLHDERTKALVDGLKLA